MKRFLIIIILLRCAFPLWSQYDRLDSILLDVIGNTRAKNALFDKPAKCSFLYTGITIDNKTFYAGRELGNDMRSVNGSLYYFHSGGLYVGATGSWYSGMDPNYSLTGLTAGIREPLNKKKNLNFRISYTRYLFNAPDSLTTGASKNSLGAGLSLRNKWIGSRLSINTLFGKDFGMYLTPTVFSDITLARFGKYGKIMLAPEVSLFIGPEMIETYSVRNPSDTMNLYASRTGRYGVLNALAFLPAGISTKNLDFEFGYSVNFPMAQDKSTSFPVSTFFTISVSYLIQMK
jgi:hypothetical protein